MSRTGFVWPFGDNWQWLQSHLQSTTPSSKSNYDSYRKSMKTLHKSRSFPISDLPNHAFP
jgi:hypothetical protein